MECDRTVTAQPNVPVEAPHRPPPNGTALYRHERQHSRWSRAHSHQWRHYNVSGGGVGLRGGRSIVPDCLERRQLSVL